MAPRACSLCGTLIHDKTVKFCVSCGATLPPVGLVPQQAAGSSGSVRRGTSINDNDGAGISFKATRRWARPDDAPARKPSKCLFFMAAFFLSIATGALAISGLDLQVRWDTGNYGPHDDHYDVTFDAGVVFIGGRFKNMELSPKGLPPVCKSGEAPPCSAGLEDDDLLLDNQIPQPCITMWGQKSTLIDLIKEHTTDHATIVQYTDYVQKQCMPIKIRAACLAAAVILAAFAAYINIAMLCCGCCSPSCATTTSLLFATLALAGAGVVGFFTYQQKMRNPRPLLGWQQSIYNGTRHTVDDDDAIQHLSFGWGFYELAGAAGMLLFGIICINANICCHVYACCGRRRDRGEPLLTRP